jgi:hypothetical protein
MNGSPSTNGEWRAPPAAGSGCGSCAHFHDDPGELERLFRGIGALSSAYGSTRGRAGVCLVDGAFRDPAPACPDYRSRGEGEPT